MPVLGFDELCRSQSNLIAEPTEAADMDHFCDGERNIQKLSSAITKAENVTALPKYALPELQICAERTATAEPDAYPELEADRLKLKQLAALLPPSELQQFKDNMQTFETRMERMEGQYRIGGETREQAHAHAVNEMRNTYSHIGRLFTDNVDTTTGVTSIQRFELAKQILSNAANPNSIDQGQHSTCNVNTVEVRTFTRNPSAAARVIVNAALGGFFSTKDNHTIVINKESLQPDKEASQFPAPDGARNYASQIFQVAAINAYYQPETNGKVRYVVERANSAAQPPTPGGDYLMDYSTDTPKKLRKPSIVGSLGVGLSGKPDDYANTPQMSADRIKIAGERISGDRSDWIFTDSSTDSEESLRQHLSEARKHGNLPVVIQVNTNNEPFYTDSGAGSAGGSGGWHVVTVPEYIPASAKAKVDNSWGTQADHSTANSALTMHDLYASMQDPSKSINLLRNDIDWNRSKGIVCEYKEVDLIRMQHQAGQLSGDAYEKAIRDRLVHLHDRIADHSATVDDVQTTKSKLFFLIYNLPDGKSFDIRNEELKLGLVDNNEFKTAVVYDFYKLSLEHKTRVKAGTNDDQSKSRWTSSLKELTKSLDLMSADDRKLVVDVINANRMLEDE